MKWKNTGAVKIRESSRSRMPPWPGSSVPLSFTPISRFIADITTSQQKPLRPIIKPASSDNGKFNGVMTGPSTAAISVVVATPPTNPASVLLGLTLGVILMRPIDLPHSYCAISLNSVKPTKNSTSNAPVCLPSSGRISKNATWLKAKTVVIRLQ